MNVPLLMPTRCSDAEFPLAVTRILVKLVKKDQVPAIPDWRIIRAANTLCTRGLEPGKELIEMLLALQDGQNLIRCLDCFIHEDDPILTPFLLFLSAETCHGFHRVRFGELTGTRTAVGDMVHIAESIFIERLSPADTQALACLFDNIVIALPRAFEHVHF